MTLFDAVSFQDKLLFTKHLSIMLSAGLPIVEALTILRDQTRRPAMKEVLAKIVSEVENGQNLEKAFGKFPVVFDPLYLSIIQVGEESGKLDKSLVYLADEMLKSSEFTKKVRGAMLYPMIIFFTVIVVGGAIAVFVLPNLIDLFKSMDISLPWTTRALLWVAQVMKDFGVGIMGGTILAIFGFMALIQTKPIKHLWHGFVLKTPVFGTLSNYSNLATICRSLSIMLSSGLTITRALKIVTDTTPNMVYKKYLATWLTTVEAGKSLGGEMGREKYWAVPAIVPKMVEVGEKTGTLDKSLLYLADYFTSEVDDIAKNLPTVIEPIMLFGVALMVAFLAFAVISPIYQFTGSIHK